jgi:hypothetical protein
VMNMNDETYVERDEEREQQDELIRAHQLA